MMKKIFLSLIFLTFFSKIIYAQTYQNIDIPCEVKECKPEWGETYTRWYKGVGNKKKPAIEIAGFFYINYFKLPTISSGFTQASKSSAVT